MEVTLKSTDKESVQTPLDTYEIIQRIFYKRHKKDVLKEHFWTIALNRGLKIVCIELVSIGSNARTIAAPQEIFRLPLYKSASQVVLVHNHPSGILEPSEADLNTTNKLIQAGLLFDIDVVDHVIVTKHSYFSFCDNGLIEKLRWDRKYALTFIRDKQVAKEIARIKRETERHKDQLLKKGKLEGIKQGEIKGAKARGMQIAKKLLQQGVDPAIVKRTTGVTHQWIGRLKNELERA